MKDWLTGKKTYLLAAAVALALALLVYFGKLTPSLALDILAFSAPAFAATFRDALKENHKQLLGALTGLAQAGIDMRSHNTAGLMVDCEKVLTAAQGVSISFTGEPQQVVAAVSALRTERVS